MDKFIDLTPENIENEHLCCIIRSKKTHPGVEAKRAWLAERLTEGHIFRKLDEKATVFIEYAPLEKAWVPIEGDNYIYIYCLWVLGDYREHGYGKKLMESCIADARARGRSGVCMLGSLKQKAWLSDQAFAKRFGFVAVDTAGEYELLALSFDGSVPHFNERAKAQTIDEQELTVYYSPQCPYTYHSITAVEKYCEGNGIPYRLIKVDTLQKAKELPCVFNNHAVFYKGKFVTVNLLDEGSVKRILK